jgi:predicted short-subunit dehydrogenase-like oxidoreductase (DUF2520 family)
VDIIVAAPGRAGGSLALAAEMAGHRIVGVISRSGAFDGRFRQLTTGEALPAADLLVIGSRDVDIESMAAVLAPVCIRVRAAVHLSGYKSLSALAPLREVGCDIGSFHPLQTLPDPVTGSKALAGSWVAVTAGAGLLDLLWGLAVSLGMTPFEVADADKPAYHAGAAAASNFVISALDLAQALFQRAGLPFTALQPLTVRAVANAFEHGPRDSLTGPVAREDWETVSGQMRAVAELGLERLRQFQAMTAATAITAGRVLPEELG